MLEARHTYKNVGFSDVMDYLIEIYGEEKAQELCCIEQSYADRGKSWECRDCCDKTDEEYFAKYAMGDDKTHA